MAIEQPCDLPSGKIRTHRSSCRFRKHNHSAQKAVSLTSSGDNHCSIYPDNFGNALLRRFEMLSLQKIYSKSASITQESCCEKLSDWKKDPLSIGDFNDLRRERRQLMYLSACHFPQGIESFSDHMHFTVSCNATGFSQVIGTLWHLDSASSARVAQVVYETIKGHDDNCFIIEKAAQGLHSAARMLRKQTRTDPLLWARYFHSGV